MLGRRVTWAVAFATPLLLLLAADYYASGAARGIWLLPLAMLVAIMAAAEMLAILSAEGFRPVAWSVYGGTALVVAASGIPLLLEFCPSPPSGSAAMGELGWSTVALAAAVVLAFVAEMRRFAEPGGASVRVAIAVLVVTYSGLLTSFLTALRRYQPGQDASVQDGDVGLAALFSLIVVVKLSDIGAYAAGRLMGRHKMAPRLSPNKTVEGAVGGVLAACLASWLMFTYLVPPIAHFAPADGPRWGWLWYGLILAAAGMAGDLAISLLKRDMGRKDSSRWLPGLGGVLDMIDSVLVAAPAAYLCWVLGVIGPSSG